jgi:predicted metallopeptidase
MHYEAAYEIQEIAKDVIAKLNMSHIDCNNVVFLRSHGSKSRRTLARIHGLPKIMQKAMNIKALYVVEIISENFDKLENEDKVKTVIHELMHIPKCFGGGFRNHGNFVTRKNVENAYKEYMRAIPQGHSQHV